jgi:Tfp pilus assembly protein PilO
MSYASLFLDVRADPVSPLPWGALIVLLVVVFVLAVGFAAAMVVLLIWLKRRKAKQAELANQELANHDRAF